VKTQPTGREHSVRHRRGIKEGNSQRVFPSVTLLVSY
jgi:hypothetical protein